MTERKDEKWLDEQLQRAVEGTTPVFNAEAWKQKHQEEYQALVARSEQTAGQGLPSSVKVRSTGGSGKRSLRSLPMVSTRIPQTIGKLRLPLPPRRWAWWGKLAMAATIAMVVGLFVIGRNGHEPGGLIEPPGPVATSSPVRMMSMMSLRMAYQQGGFEALDQQLHDTLDEFRPRSSSVPIRGLFSM